MKSTATKLKISGKSAPSVILQSEPTADAVDRLNSIAIAAYYKAEARGFLPGQDLDDWLEAEAEIDEKEGC